MVAAVARSWGVDPIPGDGKVVWAVVGAGDGDPDPELDLDARFALWETEPGDAEFTIRLGAVPTGLLLDAKRHIDNVVRELTLARAGATERLPAELEALINTVVHDFARARAGLKEQASAAAARGETHTDLVLTLPVSSIEAGRAVPGARSTRSTATPARRASSPWRLRPCTGCSGAGTSRRWSSSCARTPAARCRRNRRRSSTSWWRRSRRSRPCGRPPTGSTCCSG